MIVAKKGLKPVPVATEAPAARPRSKVFGIGLSKTGTNSLNKALEILGYRSIHYPPLDQIPSILSQYDAATDSPIAYRYEQLDSLFPGSRFILTVRDLKSWLASCERQFSKPVPKEWMRLLRLRLYGSPAWDERKFSSAYRMHLRRVKTHFRRRPRDLLIMNIVAGDGWAALCGFLGKPVPAEPFPYCNRTSCKT